MSSLFKIKTIIGPSLRKLPLIVLIFIFSSLLDLAGISSVAILIKIMMSPDSNQTIFTNFSNIFSESTINNFAGIVLSIFIAKFLFSNIVNFHINKFSEDELCRLRFVLISNFFYTDFLSINKNNSSNTIQEIYAVTHQFASGLLLSGLRLLSEVIIVFFIGSYLLLSIGYPILIVGSVFIFFLVLSELVFKKYFSSYGEKLNISNNEILNEMIEIISGYKDLKIYSQETNYLNKFNSSAISAAKVGTISKTLLQAQKYLLELIISIFFLILIYTSFNNNQGPAEILSIISILAFSAIKLLPSFNAISYGVSQFRLSKNDVDILFSRLSNAKSNTSIKSNHSLIKFNTIQLKDISFKYNEKTILDSISLTINKNEFVGITGESGSGKTSLLNIILGLIKPNSGSILFNGENLNGIDPSVYQKQFGMVSQDIFLPSGSLAKSICFEDLNELNANNLTASIKKVNLESFLSSQKFGFNTDIGENGAFLSGGQKQRIALARSFYFNRSILILDEPTSSLDSKAQDDILTSLEVLLKSMTIILVTHNKKLLRNCTKVYELIDSKLLDISTSSHS